MPGTTRRRIHTHCVQRDWKTHGSTSSVHLCRVNIIPHLNRRNKQTVTHKLRRGDLNSPDFFCCHHSFFLHQTPGVKVTSPEPGRRTLTSRTPGSVTGHASRAPPMTKEGRLDAESNDDRYKRILPPIMYWLSTANVLCSFWNSTHSGLFNTKALTDFNASVCSTTPQQQGAAPT